MATALVEPSVRMLSSPGAGWEAILETAARAPAPDRTKPMAEPARDLALRLQGLNIYLVGMMGAGKSAVGRPLAESLGYRFLDADTSISRAARRPIPEIFRTEGEEGFRELETAVLAGIASWHSLVVATGGGVVTRPSNWGHLRQGAVVWLDAPVELLLERLRRDPTPRPLLAAPDPEARLRQLLEQRRPLYAQADLHLTQAGETPAEVAAAVLQQLPAILREPAAVPENPVVLVDGEGQKRRTLN
jgi:shikimate kinase